MSTTIYPTATDHINKHPYTVYLPPFVLEVHPEVELQAMFSPVYEAFDANLRQRGKITIARMVEYASSQVVFTIIDDYDVLAILHQIDAYVEEVYPLRSQRDIGVYIEKILKLRSRIYALFMRVLHRHPQWKIAYSHGKDIFGFLLSIYRPLGISIDVPQTLLEELEICPTVREHPQEFAALTPTAPAPKPAATAKPTSQRPQYDF